MRCGECGIRDDEIATLRADLAAARAEVERVLERARDAEAAAEVETGRALAAERARDEALRERNELHTMVILLKQEAADLPAAAASAIRDLEAALQMVERARDEALAEVDRLTGYADDYWKAQKVAEAERDEALAALRWVANNYNTTLGGKSVRDADECLESAARILATEAHASEGCPEWCMKCHGKGCGEASATIRYPSDESHDYPQESAPARCPECGGDGLRSAEEWPKPCGACGGTGTKGTP